ncbi:hypothetical protein [Mesorhizobium sp.]|uniref:hypothetical protein n=1 Tax=Mesorhizobium sp. TaxID=1871066 RepID=UPI0025DBE06D|nr:hypothetical protein [Mesorhizobium sp.]
MRKDLHDNIKIVHAITPQAVGTSGIAGGKLSAILDLKQSGVYYRSAEFVFSYGTTASAADTIVPVIYEAAATGDSFTSVADADLLGLETPVVLSAAGSSKIGYRGNKRYLKIRLYGTGHATGIVSAALVLGRPDVAPTA